MANLIESRTSISDILAPSAVNMSPNHIQIEDKFLRCIFISAYPRFLAQNWFSSIINLDTTFSASIYIHPQDTAEILRKLRDQLTRLQADIIENDAAGKLRDPALETAIGDIEALRDSLQQGTDKFFRFGVYITLVGDNLQQLDDTEAKIRSMLEAQLLYLKPATFRQREGFISTMPLNQDLLSEHTPLNTGPISSSFPFVSYDLTSDNGILYGINTQNNSLILFDRYSLENANTVIFGKSGGGKSYTVKLEILRSLMFGAQVFVIDPENEYRYLADTVGGTNVKISISSPDHINPFDIPRSLPDESPQDTLRSHMLNLQGFFKILLGQLSSEEDAYIEEAIRQTYALKDISIDVDFSGKQPPIMAEFQSILEGITGAEGLATRLQKYSQGVFSGFLNNLTNIDLNKQLVVFSIRDMEEELRPVAMYLVLNFVWTQIRSELKKRILVVDEAWLLMKYDIGGSFLFNMAKRARKYFLGLTTISQDVADFMNSQYGKAIITNSSLQILLKQSPASVDIVQQTFNLTDPEKYFLLDAQVGNGLFFAGNRHVTIRIVASYAEDQVITSDPKQILEIEQAKKELAGQ